MPQASRDATETIDSIEPESANQLRYSAYYVRAPALFRDLEIARADGSCRTLLARLSRIDVLVMAPMKEQEGGISGRFSRIGMKCGR